MHYCHNIYFQKQTQFRLLSFSPIFLLLIKLQKHPEVIECMQKGLGRALKERPQLCSFLFPREKAIGRIGHSSVLLVGVDALAAAPLHSLTSLVRYQWEREGEG